VVLDRVIERNELQRRASGFAATAADCN